MRMSAGRLIGMKGTWAPPRPSYLRRMSHRYYCGKHRQGETWPGVGGRSKLGNVFMYEELLGCWRLSMTYVGCSAVLV